MGNPSSSAYRRSKSAPDHSKKPLKNARKNMNSEFDTLVEGVALSESPKDSADFSLISEVYESTENARKNESAEFSLISEVVDDVQLTESNEELQSFVFPLLPEAPTSSGNIFLHDPTTVSTFGISSNMFTTSTASTYLSQSAEEKTSMETEIAIKHLRQALFRPMNNSHGISLRQPKRLVDALVEVVVREVCGSTRREKNCSNSLTLKKMFLLVSLSFLLVPILALLFSSLHTSSATPRFVGPLPT
ncbi:unnamed protein product [Cuscuta campestris]|uniref:Uncharacterized protein n=2 Tax=Cuscuta sect. Cleistogrammica TaxID=1824901 RepID=A0A484KKV9_9ASTE|nr:hypothetical protein DM860_017492 [Cuscuta australis]VFQ62656.1 unnamed protein product [Cuscuta campestris]